jgi:hypothetical protein
LVNFEPFTSLQAVTYVEAGFAAGKLSLFCTTYPAFAGISTSNFPVFPLSSSQVSFVSLTCDACAPIFNATFPLMYTFTGALPQSLHLSDGAGLSVVNTSVVSGSFILSLASVSRLNSLTFDNVNTPTMDGLIALHRIDNGLVIQNCVNLTNIDGLTVNLQTVGSVSITDNPLLCNIDISRLEVVSQTNPVINSNGPAFCTGRILGT